MGITDVDREARSGGFTIVFESDAIGEDVGEGELRHFQAAEDETTAD